MCIYFLNRGGDEVDIGLDLVFREAIFEAFSRKQVSRESGVQHKDMVVGCCDAHEALEYRVTQKLFLRQQHLPVFSRDRDASISDLEGRLRLRTRRRRLRWRRQRRRLRSRNRRFDAKLLDSGGQLKRSQRLKSRRRRIVERRMS